MSGDAPLVVHAPAHAGPGFNWVCEVLLGRFLGLPWRAAVQPAAGFAIDGPAGRIEWPDLFFAATERDGLGLQAMPSLPIEEWPLPDAELCRRIGHERLPLLHGDGHYENDAGRLRLPLDLFGAAFFMLSRWEEALPGAEQDRHGRFPGAASVAQRAGLLRRPIVDEYVELLWWALQQAAPGLQRAPRQARTWVTCDVDAPYAPGAKGLGLALRQAAGHLVHDRSAWLAGQALLNAATSRAGVTRFDAFDTFDWMLDRLAMHGHQATFFFLAVKRPRRIDGVYELGEGRITALLRKLVQRGHDIGLHGSYDSACDALRLADEAQALRAAVAAVGGRQSTWAARQHYLRWRAPHTARHLEAAGFDFDSTLGYADAPGFRCGTCHAYPLFDLQARQPLRIVERPLVLMEVSVTSRSYLGLDHSDAARELMFDLQRSCRRFGGEFTLLWHNSNLLQPEARALYEDLLRGVPA